MASFLLTWNPKIFKWVTLDEDITRVETGILSGHPYKFDWSVMSVKPAAGDDFYLTTVGYKPVNGIVGLGRITSDAYPLDSECRRRGINIEFHKLVNPDHKMLVETPVLQSIYPDQLWTPQCSGISIHPECEKLLKELW